MSFICNNLAPIFVALNLAAIAWMFGGAKAAPLEVTVPWMFLFMMQMILCFPQKHPGESTYAARTRVWKQLRKDPLVWVSTGLILLLAIPFVNNGFCPSCDRELYAMGLDPNPPISFLPYCVNRMHHLNVFYWFLTALSAMIAVKHALNRSGKRLMLALIVANGFVLAILGFVQIAAEAPGPLWQPFASGKLVDYFSTFGYPNMAGDYFTTLFGISLALWRWDYEAVSEELRADRNKAAKNKYRWFWKRNLFLIPAVVFFFAAVNTLSRASMILASVLAVIYFVHTFMSFTKKMHRADKVKKGGIALGIMALLVFFASVSIPENMQREVDTLNTDAILTRVTGKGQYHARVATEIWKDNLLFGCGGWGYKHFCIPKMTPEEIKQIQMVGGINVHNDYLQFLAEHGLVGFGSMVAIVVILLIPVGSTLKRLANDARFLKGKDLPPKPVNIFVCPAPVFFILLAAVSTLVHSFGDCAMRSAAVLTLFFVSLAALPGFLPELPAKGADKEHHSHHHHH